MSESKEYYVYYQSPLGMIVISARDGAVTGLWFLGQKYFADTLSEDARFISNIEDAGLTEPVLAAAADWLNRYFAGEKPALGELRLSPQGSPFRQAVWKILMSIPYGSVVTYKDIAAQLAAQAGRESMSAQAVGGAVAHNPISIIIPCHRVVGSDGSLTGYAGGLDRKTLLLRLEGINTDRMIRK